MRSEVLRVSTHAMAADCTVLLALVEEFVSGQQDGKAAVTATGVKAGQFTILQLVEALGLSLTSSQPQTRARGVQLLSQVLHECAGDLSNKEVEVLIAFYENRVKDHYVVTPHVLQGIKALSRSTAWPPGLAVSVLKSLFQDVHVQSLMLLERSCVYTILINLMESQEEELKSLGADFVFGFIQAIDGERDPRNLLLAFKIAQKILHRGYELGKFSEELFEVTSCYFPIDFTPPPSDPHGITQEELILALRAVLTGTPHFAEYLLPLIIEKMDTDIQSAKLDSLQTLTACASVYGHNEVKEFLPGLWSSLRREVFQTASEKVEAAGLAALTSLTACLSRSVLDSEAEDSLQVFLDLVVKDCQHHLSEPDLRLIWPSAKLLQAAASASYRARHKVTSTVLPSLLDQYNNQTQCSQRRTLLEVLQGFLQPEATLHTEGGESVLSGFREPLCGALFSALCESSAGLQVTACRLLSALGLLPGVLLPADVELAVDHLSQLVLQEEEPQVGSAVLECAGKLAALHPAVFASRMLPGLKAQIFKEPMDQGEQELPAQTQSQQAVRRRCVTALAAIAFQPSLVQECVPVFLEVFSASHKGSGCFDLGDLTAVCQSLQRIAEQVEDTVETGNYFHRVVIPHILGVALQAAVQGGESGSKQSPLVEEVLLVALVPVLSVPCARLQSHLSAQTASHVISLFLDGDISFLPCNSLPTNLQLLKSRSWSQTQLVCLLMACVCSLPKSVEVPHLVRLLEYLEELSCTCEHQFSHTYAAKCFAGLVNKQPEGQAMNVLLERTLKRITSELECSSSPHRRQAFTLLVWVTKALLLRYPPLAAPLTEKLFSLLTDVELGASAADSFSLLMSDTPDVMSRACHVNVRLMYRQRFFIENSAKLVQGFNSADKEMKSGYLKALSHMVNHLPRQVQLTELPVLLPLLLEALSCPDQEVQQSTLSCLHPILQDVQQQPGLSPHLDTLVFRLLSLTTSPDMKVRIAALRCVHALSRFQDHMVLPYRARVLRALATPLDDRKRLVRKEAVLARGEWFLLGSPGR